MVIDITIQRFIIRMILMIAPPLPPSHIEISSVFLTVVGGWMDPHTHTHTHTHTTHTTQLTVHYTTLTWTRPTSPTLRFNRPANAPPQPDDIGDFSEYENDAFSPPPLSPVRRRRRRFFFLDWKVTKLHIAMCIYIHPSPPLYVVCVVPHIGWVYSSRMTFAC